MRWRRKKASEPSDAVEPTVEATIEPSDDATSAGASRSAADDLAIRQTSELAKPTREPRGSLLSSIVGSVVEAWDEVRINRTRVLLSLIGIGVAVCALATVVGAGAVFGQAQTEQYEKSSGRPATLMGYPPYSQATQQPVDAAQYFELMDTLAERYQVSHSTAVRRGSASVQLPNGTQFTAVQGVNDKFGVMHRVDVVVGRWLSEQDGTRLAPAVVINDIFYEELGRPDLRTHPAIEIKAETLTTAVIVGVLAPEANQTGFSLSMLDEPYRHLVGAAAANEGDMSYEIWVPEEQAAQLADLLNRDIAAVFGDDINPSVNRNDYLAWGGPNPLEPLQWAIGGIAALILLLGALGLINISLVTVKYRVREIGVRRAFGATAGRVFFAVMMESVVATIAAGVIGVAVSIAIVQNPAIQNLIAPGVQDLPPYPLEAALIALGASAAVGVLAGFMPALVAVKVKVIDAIRY
ncbi:ABC transporter permease [Salinibacterium sp. M195]|uniref:ABC transporter permease n=1 Tax=Salinibacterium sp. M195 TaxID=2583374 RepID=UPI001C62612C|nr:ABC transporter permease [Salinibacterium sp. M195]QYH36453.1 ABC transporter permease [Salinibacterium sp. M195]